MLSRDGFELRLLNSGPTPVNIAQVTVDDAFWQFTQEPAGVLPRLGRATLTIPFHWVANDLYNIRLITSTGLTFDAAVPVATQTPVAGGREFLAYGLLGIYIGIVPIAIGLLWFPAMRRMPKRWLNAVLALTIGLLVFLLIDTLLEVIEIGGKVPAVFQGVPLALFSALLAWLAIMALSSLRKKSSGEAKALRGFPLALLIAASIGLHNLGEGLSVGAAFLIGRSGAGHLPGGRLYPAQRDGGDWHRRPIAARHSGYRRRNTGQPEPGLISGTVAGLRRTGDRRRLDRRVCILAGAQHAIPRHRVGRHLAGDR